MRLLLHPSSVVLNRCSRRRRGRDLIGNRGRSLGGRVRRVWVGRLGIIIRLLRLLMVYVLIRLLGSVGRPLRRLVVVAVPRIVPRSSSSSVVDKERPSSGWVDLHLKVGRQRGAVVISCMG